LILKIKRYFLPWKYKVLSRLKNEEFRILDVGCGNESPFYLKKCYPKSIYDGIDKDLSYNLSDKSVNLINSFYPLDLEKNDLSAIKNNFYDFIIMSHVIEHLDNGYEIFTMLLDKVKKGGFIYIEYPSKKSAKFPSMKGTLNFYDDPTHKKFYDIDKLTNILRTNNFIVLGSGVKRDFLRIIFIPFMIIKSLIKNHYIRGSVFWDLLGFAEYILAIKLNRTDQTVE
jgi:SAM-dependent methyltransferase